MEKSVVGQTDVPRTRESLAVDLRALGVAEGDTLLVHSSLSAIGWVCGFEVAVIQALLDAVGERGTLVMPAFSDSLGEPSHWRNPAVPEGWWELIRQAMPAYDPVATPVLHLGRVAEAFRAWPGVKRSAHPAMSFCARGPRAGEILDSHALDFGFGESSPLARLCDLTAKVLLLGVGYDRCTSFHLAEHRVPGRAEFQDAAPLMEDGKREWQTFRALHFDDSTFPRIGEDFDRTVAVKRGRVGSAECRMFGARAAVEFATEWLRERRPSGTRLAAPVTDAAAPPRTGERYRLGKELGRGGLGQVVEAWDGTLKRGVAIKLMAEGLALELSRRFVREAELTARLEHPNIVPVHDFGVLEGSERRLFLCMKRIEGRDLGRLLRDLAAGDVKTSAEYTRARLLSVFQDICLAVAFAHSRGVLHRDLKPSNVMIGEFGETLVVDWGLAKEKEAPVVGEVSGFAPARDATGEMTLDGDVVGTPAYMSPEQASGRLADVDERSDIWALGAILFEILTLRPPIEGDTLDAILDSARSGLVRAPSSVAPRRPGAAAIPPDLDALCLRAMAPRREDRFQSALDLYREIQLFLEGVKERERAEQAARLHVGRGRDSLQRFYELSAELEEQRRLVKKLKLSIPEYEGAEAKRPLWDAEDRLRALESGRAEAHAAAEAEFGLALASKPDSAEALEAKCEFYAERVMDAERRSDRAEVVRNRRALESYDRGGKFAARLDAPGRLSLRAFAYGCACLLPARREGWRVEIAETFTVPWREGRARPAEPLTDRDMPVPAICVEGGRWGHGPECASREIAGVEVRLARYAERDRRLQLVDERVLGTTPLREIPVPIGSYRCTLSTPGFAPVLLPVRITRSETWDQDVTLYRADEIPPGCRLIPGGPFIYGGEAAGGKDAVTRITEDFFASRLLTSAGEYLEFLNDLCARGRAEEARLRQPRAGAQLFLAEADGRYTLHPGPRGGSLLTSADFPVTGLSCFDALAYAAWRSAREGRVYRLLHEEEWEKAARGVDGRAYPWGNEFDGSFANTTVAHADHPRLEPSGAFAADESPYGLMDMAGNVESWCFNVCPVPWRGWVCVHGSAWGAAEAYSRTAHRRGAAPEHRSLYQGIRLAAAPRA